VGQNSKTVLEQNRLMFVQQSRLGAPQTPYTAILYYIEELNPKNRRMRNADGAGLAGFDVG
jgi:hypothetical protein